MGDLEGQSLSQRPCSPHLKQGQDYILWERELWFCWKLGVAGALALAPAVARLLWLKKWAWEDGEGCGGVVGVGEAALSMIVVLKPCFFNFDG